MKSTWKVFSIVAAIIPAVGFPQGTLTIYSTTDGNDPSSNNGTDGHTWITFTPDGSTTPTSYGTYGNRDPIGVFVNVERDSNRSWEVSRTTHLDAAQQALMMGEINRYIAMGTNGWSLNNPCSAFATDVWNKAVPANEVLQDRGSDGEGWSTPQLVKNDIVSHNAGNLNVGYTPQYLEWLDC